MGWMVKYLPSCFRYSCQTTEISRDCPTISEDHKVSKIFGDTNGMLVANNGIVNYGVVLNMGQVFFMNVHHSYHSVVIFSIKCNTIYKV